MNPKKPYIRIDNESMEVLNVQVQTELLISEAPPEILLWREEIGDTAASIFAARSDVTL